MPPLKNRIAKNEPRTRTKKHQPTQAHNDHRADEQPLGLGHDAHRSLPVKRRSLTHTVESMVDVGI